MEDELTRLKKSYLRTLTDFDEALDKIIRIGERVRRRQRKDSFQKKKYKQKKKQGAVRLTVLQDFGYNNKSVTNFPHPAIK